MWCMVEKFNIAISGSHWYRYQIVTQRILRYWFIVILAPIKRPLSRENTSPSQKSSSFFLQGQYPIAESAPFRSLRPWFQNFLVRILNWSATRHPSGSRSMKEKIKPTVAQQPSFFLSDPWSNNWTPEKHRYLAMSNGLLQNTGLKKRQP